jgi:diaminohydroxyphosphoribosylaminopyrimidine deaminase/5-amino-6-(5-phosphoribosylamino)uracil reductase
MTVEQEIPLEHRNFVEQAVALAHTIEGRTSPNPPVGAVVRCADDIVGSGATQPPGQLHAERMALQAAGPAAQGGDLYTTLEPCTFHGQTPPCTDAIIAAGIRRVFYIARDLDPRMGAGAAAVLNKAGIEVHRLPDPGGAVAALLAPFRCRVALGRPLVTAKYAMTLDGRIATVTGESQWISGPASRRQVHLLRDRVDAMMIGVDTVLTDDPQLTTRLDNHWRLPSQPLRVIVDSRGRTPLTARLLDPMLPGQTLCAVVDPPAAWVSAVERFGVRVERLPADASGRVALPELLTLLAALGVNHLLVEGGSALLGALAAARLIDEVWAFIAPKLLGGATAPGPLGDPGVAHLSNAFNLVTRRVERHGDDLLLVATAAAPWWDAV